MGADVLLRDSENPACTVFQPACRLDICPPGFSVLSAVVCQCLSLDPVQTGFRCECKGSIWEVTSGGGGQGAVVGVRQTGKRRNQFRVTSVGNRAPSVCGLGGTAWITPIGFHRGPLPACSPVTGGGPLARTVTPGIPGRPRCELAEPLLIAEKVLDNGLWVLAGESVFQRCLPRGVGGTPTAARQPSSWEETSPHLHEATAHLPAVAAGSTAL